MRLTLRTLLAWRDGTLPASHREEMDGKVAANAAAHLLTARLDRAVADDTLAAPPAGAASDPNAVAEYLDNSLPVAGLDGFERACLNADDLLGEVASCHRILAEASLEPGVIPTLRPADRARLVRAVQARSLHRHTAHDAGPESADRHAKPEGMAGQVAATAAVTIAGASSDATPRGPARSSLAAWLLAMAAVLLLGVLSGVLAWSVAGGRVVARRGGPGPVDRDAADTRDAAVIPPPPAVAPAPAIPPAAQGPVEAAPPVAPAVDAGVTPANPREEPSPTPPEADARAAADLSAVVPPPSPTGRTVAVATGPAAQVAMNTAAGAAGPPDAPPRAAPTVPFGDALAIAAPPAAPLPPEPTAAAAAFEAVADDVACLKVVGDDVLLVEAVGVDAATPKAWEVARSGAAPALPVRLLAPAFSRPAVEVDGLRIVFASSTKAELRRADDDLPWLVLDVGAAVVLGASGPARLRVTAGPLEGVVTSAAASPLGVEVVIDGPSHAGDPAAVVARVYATQDPVPWQQASPEPRGEAVAAVPPASTLSTSTLDPALVQIARRDVTPAWLASLAPVDAFERAARSALSAALVSGEPATPALERLGAESRSERRIAAAATLSLMGDHAPLAHLLVEDSPRRALREEEWLRLERTAVPLARSSGPHAASWREALDAAAPAGAGPVLSAILDAGDAGRRDVLVEALESPWLVARRLAWHALVDIERPDRIDRLRYRPDRPADLNTDGIRWWREHVARTDAETGVP